MSPLAPSITAHRPHLCATHMQLLAHLLVCRVSVHRKAGPGFLLTYQLLEQCLAQE